MLKLATRTINLATSWCGILQLDKVNISQNPKLDVHTFILNVFYMNLVSSLKLMIIMLRVLLVMDQMQIEVYTMSTNTWRVIEYKMSSDSVLPSDIEQGDTSMFLNGAFHWGFTK